MRLFTRTLHYSDVSTIFRENVYHPKFGTYIVGDVGNGVFISKLKNDGNIEFSKEYFIKGVRLYAYSAKFLSTGEMVLLCYSLNNKKRQTHFLICVDYQGNIIRSQKIVDDKFRYIKSFLVLEGDRIFISGWYTSSGSTSDQIYTYITDVHLSLRNFKTLSLGSDTQLGCAEAKGKQIILFGSVHNPKNGGFYIILDANLNIQHSSIFNIQDNFTSTVNGCQLLPNNELLIHTQSVGQKNKLDIELFFFRFSENGLQVRSAKRYNLQGSNKSPNNLFLLNGKVHSLIIIDGQYFICQFDNQFNKVKRYKIDLNTSSYLFSGMNSQNNAFLLGNSIDNKLYAPLLIKTNEALDGCKINLIDTFDFTKFDISQSETIPKLSILEKESAEVAFESRDIDFAILEHCGEPNPIPQFELKEPYRLQSSAISLISTGSNGEKASKGILNRWFLNGYLGNHHIPKGDESKSTTFFNRKDDYIKLYKITYNEHTKVKKSIDIFGMAPNSVEHNIHTWVYKIENRFYYLQFENKSRYDAILNAQSNQLVPDSFLSQYGANVLALSFAQDLAFGVTFNLSSNCKIQTEIFTIPNEFPNSDKKQIYTRQIIENQSQKIFHGDNFKTIKFKLYSGSINSLEIEYYSDFLLKAVENNQISSVGNYSLSLDENEVLHKRLENTAKFQVNNYWKKYNEDAYVNVDNYKKRWLQNFGLAEGVKDYIDLSEINPSATKMYQLENPQNGDKSTMEVELQKQLNIASLDFHIARMLGMGMVDAEINEQEEYVYFIEYITEKDINNFTEEKFCQHLFMTFPISTQNERLPSKIQLLPPFYGLTINNATENPLPLTDEEGYIQTIQTRYVNVKAVNENNELESLSFFNPNVICDHSKSTQPVFYGVENRKKTELEWIKPEIAHYRDYKDNKGVFETAGVLFNPEDKKATLVHEVKEEGIDVYAAYPINIFSIAGELSNEEETNYTKFKKANTLLPPSNIFCHLVQKEEPRLLTTAKEQTILSELIKNGENVLCRIDFDYSYNEDKNYQSANKIKILYRKEAPRNIIGRITAVIDDPIDKRLCKLQTSSYYYESQGTYVYPVIEDELVPNFIGSALTYNGKNYIVERIENSNSDGSNPTIVVRKIENREAISTSSPSNQLQQIYENIEVRYDQAFLLIENLANAKNWRSNKSNDVNEFPILINLDNDSLILNEETVDDSSTSNFKGIFEKAKIVYRPNTTDFKEGEYELTFNSFELKQHSQFQDLLSSSNQFSVEWHSGTVRIHTNDDVSNTKKRKTLRVLELKNVGEDGKNLTLKCFDENFKSESNIELNSENIKIGNDISVSYYPGYRVYLKQFPSIGFSETNLMPIENEGTRYSFIGLQTLDTLTLDDSSMAYHSKVSSPNTIFAREIILPLQPEQPDGPLYALPPNFQNKSTYQLTVHFKHKPFSFICYRISSEKILSLLYKSETVKLIKESLPKVTENDFSLGWQELLSFNYNGSFKEFVIDEEGNKYGFPNPDNKDFMLEINEASPPNSIVPKEYMNEIKNLILSNLLPLTENPLLYKYINGDNYIPKPIKQKILDSNGKLLSANEMMISQAPMASKVDDTTVKFADFTLDSNQSSQIVYFYSVCELGNNMEIGDSSKFLGPVQLLNTKAPAQLVVKKFYSPYPDIYNNYEASVHFVLDTFSENMDLTHIEILRCENRVDAANVRTMQVVKTVPIEDINFDYIANTFEIVDDFQFEKDKGEFIPYGTSLFYILRGVRVVKYFDFNNLPKEQIVYSEPSKVFTTNVLDMLKPASPELVIENLEVTTHQITDFELTWDKVCYSGNYSLQYLNSQNIWRELLNITSNEVSDLHFKKSESNVLVEPLPVVNDDDDKVYYKFKVQVTNTAGLENNQDTILTISG